LTSNPPASYYVEGYGRSETDGVREGYGWNPV
jgi:hypothetical protein